MSSCGIATIRSALNVNAVWLLARKEMAFIFIPKLLFYCGNIGTLGGHEK